MMKLTGFIALGIILLVLCTATTSIVAGQEMGTVPVTQDFANAIDAGMQDVIADTTFIQQYFNLMFFNVPPLETCTTKVTYPAKNPFTGRTQLNMCIETGTYFPYYDVKHLVGKMLVDKINAYYKISLKLEYRYLNTSKLGFFTTMRNNVDSGYCDMISSNTTPTQERKQVSHFQCNYGTTAQGFLRSGLDPHLQLSSLNDLNQTGIIVGAYGGTTYETLVKTKLPAATYVQFNEPNTQYQAINSKTVHALIGDAVQYLVWQKDNNSTCGGCTVKIYSEPYPYGTFITGNISRISNGNMLRGSFALMLSVLLGILFISTML